MLIRNNGSVVQHIFDTDYNMRPLLPGETMHTWDMRSLLRDDIAEVVPGAGPYYNPVIAHNRIIFADAGTEVVTIDLEAQPRAASVLLWQVEGCNVAIYRQSSANTPPVVWLRPGDNASIDVDATFDQLVLVADRAGACTVVVSRQRIDVRL